jgi:hypothetical protein
VHLKETLERLPTEWNRSVDRKSFNFKELEHVLIEKAGQLFSEHAML